MAITVKIGTTFESHVADGSETFTVNKHVGKGVWECVVLDDKHQGNDGKTYRSGHKGRVEFFHEKQIAATLAFRDFMAQRQDDADKFFESLPVGAVVHYDRSFNQYVRCKVVIADGKCPPDIIGARDETKKGKKTLMPIALVGEWSKSDLPHRLPNGKIDYGIHAKDIVEERTFRPHASNLYEYQINSSDFKGQAKKALDPRNEKPHSLKVPPQTDKAKYLANLHVTCEKISALMEKRMGPEAKLAKARALIDEVY